MAAMIVSLNEIESLTLKACRGAGMSWGLAEEAAQAARWLALHGIPWETALVDILVRRSDIAAPVREGLTLQPARTGAMLCPVHAGAAIADLLDCDQTWTLVDLLQPVWLLPLLQRRLAADAMLNLELPAGHMRLQARGFSEGGCDSAQTGRALKVQIKMSRDARSSMVKPTTLVQSHKIADTAAWKRLDAFGALTYVPASLASRLAGAGAGVSDND